MERTENEKWSERYFQLCLALIQRPSMLTTFGNVPAVNIREVMSRADRMLELLKERDKKFFTKDEND